MQKPGNTVLSTDPKRFEGIKRDYTEKDVEKLKEILKDDGSQLHNHYNIFTHWEDILNPLKEKNGMTVAEQVKQLHEGLSDIEKKVRAGEGDELKWNILYNPTYETLVVRAVSA